MLAAFASAALVAGACGADDTESTANTTTESSEDATTSAPTTGAPTTSTTVPEPPTVIVAGDSIIYDVAPALSEALDPGAAEVLSMVAPSLAAESSRIALVRQIDEAEPDVVVVMVGVWERAHVTASGFGLGDPGFGAEYRSEALDPVVASVEAVGGRLLILGPPHLREASAERQMVQLEQIWTEFAAGHEAVDFVDADTWLGDAGAFTELEQAGDRTVRLRRTDGIHLCEEGARRIATGVLGLIDSGTPATTVEPGRGWETGAWTARFPADECPPVD